MTKRLLAHVLAFLLVFAPTIALANGPGTVVFPTTQPYGVTFNGTAWSSTGAIVDYNNPANGATVAGGSLQVTVQNAPTVNLGTLNGVALDTSVNGLLVGQGSTTSGQSGPLAQGAVTTANPSYTTATTRPLSLDTNGGLRVSIIAGAGSGGTAAADEATFTQGTTNYTPAGCFFNSSVTSLTSGQGGAFQCTADRQLFVNLGKVGGNAVATAASGIAKVGLTDGTGNAITSTSSALDVNLKSSGATVNVGTHTATQALYAAGTNGFTTTPFSVLTTELNALASAGVATSSVNGTSGKFSQSSTGNALFGRCWVTLGAALGGTAVAGANFSIWFLTSTDGGTTFESATVSPPPRSPDIIIPVGASNYGASAVLMSPPRQNLWAETVKIVFQNNTGQAMGASGNIMTCGPEATTQ